MKRNKKITKIFIALSLAIVLLFAGVIGVSANEAAEIAGEVVAEDEEANIFAQIYSVAEENADKIFSALAFIGTLIVGAMYKSGLLPLLSDALGKLRGALDGIKSENERYESIVGAKISDIGNSVKSIEESIGKTNGEIARIESSLATYERALAERECMKIILSSQIDMLYSIFMASSLPQFEKEEIGNKISKMREELNSYEGNE
ncbi:MAG: hypothetical protein J6K85_01975 [Clostridia bacterium]|nr:hypothetical protein [Clostridia bacterium]